MEDNEAYSDEEMDEASMFKILIATDIHLGFLEKHPLRGDDSFVAFEEILKYGQSEEVDFVLLGGDLFHENKPSRKSVQRCMDLLRKYCLGPERNTFVFLSDPAVNFKDCSTPTVNFEDPNLRISLPIFSIHGNHDDPCGEGNYSVMDMLGASGLVNYFGKVPNLDKLTYQPLLFQKGDTYVAIYGIGSMNDDRLFRLFQEEKVFFEVPAEMEDDWFNILVLHQNRARHGCKSYAGEHFLPSFMHLVMWGHEHECRIDPEESVDDFRITQPGSSVATSLCPGEAKQKHVGILKVYKQKFRIDKLPLRTVRPFVFDTLSLDEFSDIGHQFNNDEVVGQIKKKIYDMLEEARKLISGHPEQPILPLLRLRIECDNDQQFVNMRDLHAMLGFENAVANPEDIVKIAKKRTPQESIKQEIDEEAFDAVFNMQSINMVEGHLENLLVEYYKESNKKPLLVMHERTLAEGVRYYVDKQNDDAFHDLIRLQAQKTNEQLKDKQIGNERALFREAFEQLKADREVNVQQIIDEAHSWLSGEVKVKREYSNTDHNAVDHDMLGDDVGRSPERASPAPPARGRGRGRGRAKAAATTTTTRGRGKARAAAKEEPEEDIIIESDEEFTAPAKPAPKQTARSSRASRASSRGTASTRGIAQMFARQTESQSSQRASISSALSSNANAPVTSTPATQSTPSTRSASGRKTTSRGLCYVSDDSD